MASYAALLSFMNTTNLIMNHPHLSTSLDKNLIESLRAKVGFLQEFVEDYSHGGGRETQVLDCRIASAAHAAEDVIEFQVVDQILAASIDDWESSSFLLDLKKVKEEMDSVMEEAVKIKEEWRLREQLPKHLSSSSSTTPSTPLTAGKNTMVGLDDELIHLMDELTGHQSSRRIIPITGMAGVGKTTLARNTYENLVIVQHFDVRCWVTISQEYDVKRILSDLLSCLKKETNEIDLNNEAKLGELLYKSLFKRKYLIVLDDMWNLEAWDKIKFFIPDCGDGSRVVITTRQSDMASHFDSSFLSLKFLDEDKSWELFCEKAFPEKNCPPLLEEIAKKIVKKCKGLPLAIVVIGGFLEKSPSTQKYWENVAKDMSSIMNSEENEYCSDILSLSYTYLPAHLKPCFLYMGTFPEDAEIRVSRLIKLWVAEGFLKPNKHQSLEEVGEDCLKDLVSRNLISVGKWGLNVKIKTCYIHDLLRDLCLRIGEKEEKFFCVMKIPDLPRIIDMERRVVFHGSIPQKYQSPAFLDLQSISLARSLVCDGGLVPLKFALLRVLNVVDSYSPEAIFKQVNLRYAAYKPTFYALTQLPRDLPSSISLLWNLQTFIVEECGYFVAPVEIWKLLHLRHLELHEMHLPDPPSDSFVLENLQTLSKVVDFNSSEEVCKRIPNIKKLHVHYDEFWKGSHYYFGDLHKLESLKWSFSKSPNQDDLLQNLTLPVSLKKLSLTKCCFQWQDLEKIGSLPHLEVLKLEENSVVGTEWNPVEGEFRRLKFLKIACSDLVCWNADNSHFPVLEELFLASLMDLNEIPLDIGEITTLRVVRLEYCSHSGVVSAMKILEEQESLGNEGLEIRVQFVDRSELERFMEYMEEEGFTSSRFQAEATYDKSPFTETAPSQGSVISFKI